jgi:CubicO group peptidase (beta-lactamase class C family)
MRITLFFFIAIIGLGCNNTPAITDELDALFSAYFKNDEPGGAVLVAKEDSIIYQKGFGLADINTKEAISTKTLFNTGSISKTFVAYGILQLARDGKLSLEDDLHKYFPDFKDSSIAKKIKIYHFLTHTSGLPDNRKITGDSVFYLTAKDEESFAPVKQNDSLHFEPGEQYEYSNPAFNGLALIIEKVTGQKWQDYIREKIFEPAGMKTSTITDGPHPEKAVSHGYLYDGKSFFEKDYGEEPTFAASGNGGIWSSVEELLMYEQAIQQYKFLDSAWIQQSRKVFPLDNWKSKEPSALGLSWFITSDSLTSFIGHTGSQGGFRADYLWIPGKKIFYVILCNTPKPLMEMRGKLFDYLSKNNWLE